MKRRWSNLRFWFKTGLRTKVYMLNGLPVRLTFKHRTLVGVEFWTEPTPGEYVHYLMTGEK